MNEPLESVEESIEDRVAKVMPKGQLYKLPDEWATKFAALEIRKESPSSLVNFLACPLKWFVERHSGLPPKDDINMSALVGTFVHRILEVFYSEPAKFRTEKLLLETLEVAWDDLNKGDGSDGIITMEILRDYKKMQASAYNKDAQRGRFYKIAVDCILAMWDFDGDPAKLEVLSNEGWVRGKYNNTVINGRIDRTVRGPGNSEIIQDYKTGKAPEIEPDENGIIQVDPLDPTFIPAGLYAWMRVNAQKNPRNRDLIPMEVKAIQLLYVAHLKRYTLAVNEQLIRTMDLLIESVVKEMDEVAYTGEIIAVPTESPESPPCRWCPIVDVCPAWSDDEKAMDDLFTFVNDKIDLKKAKTKK